MLEYKDYRITVSDHLVYTPEEYHIWHITHYNGAKLTNELAGSFRYNTTTDAVYGAKAWIDRQLAKEV